MPVQRHYTTAITTTAVVSAMAFVLSRLDGDLKSSPPGYVRMLQAVTVLLLLLLLLNKRMIIVT